jgi:hypothetical protein
MFPKGETFAHNFEAISYLPLEDRPAFKMAIHRDGQRWYLYTAHFWHAGWSIVDITDPARPRFVKFIEGPENTWTLQIQIAEGRMITALERIPPGWGGDPDGSFDEGFLIWDLADPENPTLKGQYKTGGAGTHRNYYDAGRYVHTTALPEGYDGHIYQIVDIDDPANPVEVSRWWVPGQWLAGGETGLANATFLHGGAYVKGARAYLPYSAGGFVTLDIADVSKPRLISDLSFSPPFLDFICVHTALPLNQRNLVVVNSEAIQEGGNEALNHACIVDVAEETNPRLISMFPLPAPPEQAAYRNFYEKGGRFGPHNQHQPQNQDCLYQNEDLVFLTYFNAGLRVYDIRDERMVKEVGYFIPPDPEKRLGPLPETALVCQTEDVLIDARGNIFISDKNHGVYVLRYADLPI